MKRNVYLSLICYIFFLNCTKGQNWDWVIKTGNAGMDEAHSIGVDKQSNVYVTANDYNFSGGGSSSGSYYNEWLYKFDPTGQLIWKTQLDIGGTKAVTDSLGNIYITAGGFLEKYNSIGTKIWSKNFVNAGMKNIILHPEGGVIVSGQNMLGKAPQFGSITLSGNSRYYLARVDETGTPLWAKEEANDFYVSSLAIDSKHRLFGLGSAGAGNKHIRRYSKAGQLEIQLTQNLNGTEDKLCIDTEGNSFITGFFDDHNPLVLNGITYTCNCPQNSSMYSIKYDSTGAPIWVKIFTGNSLGRSHLVSDKNNNVYLTTSYTSINVDSISLSSIGTEGVVFKFDTDGHIIWAKNTTGATGTYAPLANPAALAVNNIYEVFIAGSVKGNVSFDSYNLSHQSMYKDLFVAKISDNNIVTTTKVKDDLPKELAVYPNPNRGIFTVKIEGIQSDLLKLEVRNVLGQRIYSKTYKNQNNDFIDQIDISNQSKGIYLIEIIADKAKHVKKIVIE